MNAASQRDAFPRPRRAPWAGLLLALATLIVTGTASLAAREANLRTSESELQQRLARTGEVLAAGVSGVSATIYSAAQWADQGLTRPELLRRIKSQAFDDYIPSMVVLDIRGATPRVVRRISGRVGALGLLTPNVLVSMRGKVRVGYGGVSQIVRVKGERLITGFVPIAGSPGRVVYAEGDVLRALLPRVDELSRSIWFAGYLGPFEISSALVASNSSKLPLTGARAQTLKVFEGWPVTLVVSPRTPLIGTFAALVPWMILTGGVLLAVSLGGFVEAQRRRRDQAITLARSLELASRALSEQAYTDSLTGLGNRDVLMEQLAGALASRSPGEVALILIDLDDFKTVNDSLGHVAGDLLLTAIGTRLDRQERTSDRFVRLGGDEFAALVVGPSARREARLLADATHTLLEEPFILDGREITIRASVGIATSVADTESPEDLLRNADVAMYSAKGDPQHRVGVFSAHMLEAVQARHQLASELESAIAAGQIVGRYQPIVDLRTGRIAGFETLARWRHSQRGELAGEAFIGLAEQYGAINALGWQMLVGALAQVARWRLIDPDIRVTVNVSGLQLRDPGFADRLAVARSSAGVEADALMLEVTETVLVEGDMVAANLLRLTEHGIQLALDDFGAGFSSFEYLRRMPFALLKVDRSLLSGPVGPRDRAFLTSLVGFAQSQGLQTVAEGVETETELELIQFAGFAYGQGYQFGRPMTPSQVDVFLANSVSAPVMADQAAETQSWRVT